MFFSVEHLLGRNSNFTIVWRVAHTPEAKLKSFLTRSRALGIPVNEVCQGIMSRIPSGGMMDKEMSSKFSLYLLGELLYGSVRIVERQLFFLTLDARAAYDQIRELIHGAHLFALQTSSNESLENQKRRHKRKAREPLDLRDVDLTLPQIQSMDECDTLIGQAHLATITLQEDIQPRKQMDVFGHFEDDLMPLTREQQLAMETGIFDFELEAQSRELAPSTILTSSLSENTRKNDSAKPRDSFSFLGEPPIGNENSVTAALDHVALDLIPPRNSLLFDNPFNDTPNNAGIVDFTNLNDLTPFGDLPNPLLQEPLEGFKSPNNLTATIEAQGAVPPADNLVDHMTKDVSLLLEEIGQAPTRTPKKKRRNGKISDSRTQLTYEEMKNMQLDYSSLLRSSDDLGAKPPAKIPLCPQFSERPFCNQLKYLYNPCDVERMTMEEADEVGLFGQVNRGPESKLWHYSESESGESESKRSKLDQPMEINMDRPEWTGLDQIAGDVNSLGIAFLDATPPRYRYDQPGNGRDDFTTLEPLPMDLGLNDRPLSRLSEFEEERRRKTASFGLDANFDTFNTDKPLENAWGHGTSGMLQFSQLGMTDITQTKSDVDYQQEILRSVIDDEEVAFSTIVPVMTTSRKQAARAFYSLLELTAQRKVLPSQAGAYTDIYISNPIH